MFAHNFKNRFDGDFGGFGHGGDSAGWRMGRGMMEPVILRTLLEKPMHGYEIISSLEQKSHGFWRPSAGSVYPTLQLLEEKGYVTVSKQDGKKTYTLTAEGEAQAHESDKFQEHWNKQREMFKGRSFEEMREMRETMGSIMHDMRVIYRKGSDEQRTKMHELVENLRRELHTTVKEK